MRMSNVIENYFDLITFYTSNTIQMETQTSIVVIQVRNSFITAERLKFYYSLNELEYMSHKFSHTS